MTYHPSSAEIVKKIWGLNLPGSPWPTLACHGRPNIFIAVGVALRKVCRLGLGTVLISLLWLKVIGIWRKLHNVWLHKLYLPPDIIRVKEGRKEGVCLDYVE
jgi:hypothetical protein